VSKKNTAALFTVVLLAILALPLSACGSKGLGSATPTPMPAVMSYERALFTVERGPIISEKDMRGEIVPSRQDELFFRTSGFTTRVTVKTGDRVKKGDILAELQIDDLLNQLQQAEIDLEVAQSNLAKYNTQHAFDIEKAETDVVLWEKRVALAEMDVEVAFGRDKTRAELNLDMAKQNLELAKRSYELVTADYNPFMEQTVKRSQLAVDRLSGLINERQIVAPYDCIVMRAMIRAGQSVDAYMPAFVVGDPAELVVRTPSDSSLLNIISKDREVRLLMNLDDEESYSVHYLPNFLPFSFTPETESRSLLGTSGQNYFYFSYPEDFDQEELPVGRAVHLIMVLGKKDDTLLLPPAAIREYRGLRFVIVQEGERRRRVEINEIGLRGIDRWEINADLEEGDQVLGP
jgi:hypothetical protein